MYKFFPFVIILFLVSCKTTTFYVVRHAEKETTNTMTNDVPLSTEGRQRAEALKEVLQNKNVGAIYSTNYLRTKSTAQPLAERENIAIQIYDPRDTGFVSRIRNISSGNVLIVGHSNTVDDIVNKLEGKTVIPGDLPESEYGDLFVVKRKGKKYSFEKKHFGL
ncbi:MAG: SixA phosphatase family protein [Flavisolibacter sp.]|jgi:broad specificity phosphatase PhoE